MSDAAHPPAASGPTCVACAAREVYRVLPDGRLVCRYCWGLWRYFGEVGA
jgi:hypothetical protein